MGGDDDTACQLDIPLRNCNLHPDGQSIVLNGRVIPEAMRAPGR